MITDEQLGSNDYSENNHARMEAHSEYTWRSMREKHYTIPISPIPWRRAGIGKTAMCGTKFYDTQINEKIAFGLYLIKQHGSDPIFKTAISIDITFHMKKPFRDKKTSKIYHHTKPDLDNLIKLLLDAIVATKTIMTDDNIVSIINAQKIFSADPRTEFTIRELE
jgi:Holliday junction resolvase RusA-like endonuclease